MSHMEDSRSVFKGFNEEKKPLFYFSWKCRMGYILFSTPVSTQEGFYMKVCSTLLISFLFENGL